MVDRLEEDCDRFNADLPSSGALSFREAPRLPRGCIARTICRRAERRRSGPRVSTRTRPLVGVYLNRLSDLLFILARSANALAERDEPLWKPGATRD